MANSIHKGYIRFPASVFGDNFPMGTSYTRDCIVNNAAHIADEAGQVRANFVLRAGEYWQPETDASFFRPVSPAFGPFPVSVKPDGSSYNVVIRVRGHLASAGTVTVRAVLSSLENLNAAANSSGSATFLRYTEQTCATTTDGWLTASTDDWVQMGAVSVSNASHLYAVPDGAGEDALAQARMTLAYALVLSKGSVGFRMTGLYIREYVGL